MGEKILKRMDYSLGNSKPWGDIPRRLVPSRGNIGPLPRSEGGGLRSGWGLPGDPRVVERDVLVPPPFEGRIPGQELAPEGLRARLGIDALGGTPSWEHGPGREKSHGTLGDPGSTFSRHPKGGKQGRGLPEMRTGKNGLSGEESGGSAVLPPDWTESREPIAGRESVDFGDPAALPVSAGKYYLQPLRRDYEGVGTIEGSQNRPPNPGALCLGPMRLFLLVHTGRGSQGHSMGRNLPGDEAESPHGLPFNV